MDPSHLTAQQTAVDNVQEYARLLEGYVGSVDIYPGEAITTFDRFGRRAHLYLVTHEGMLEYIPANFIVQEGNSIATRNRYGNVANRFLVDRMGRMHYTVRDTFMKTAKDVDSIILTPEQGPTNRVAFKSAPVGTTAFPLNNIPPIAVDSTPAAPAPSTSVPLAPFSETRATPQQNLAQDNSGITHMQPPLKPFVLKLPPPKLKGIVRHQSPAAGSAVYKELPLTREEIPVAARPKRILRMIAEEGTQSAPVELKKRKMLPREDEFAVAMESSTGHMQDFTMGEYEFAMNEDEDGKWPSTL